MRLALVVVIFGSFLAVPLALGDTWVLRNGDWTRLSGPATAPSTQPVNEPVLDEAQRLLDRKEPGRAKDLLLDWEKKNKKNPARDRCIFLLSEVFFQQESRVKSFYYLDELMDEYPESTYFTAALQKQFDIGDAYLRGYKESFLGFRILDRGDDGVQMMYRIQQRSPGSPLAKDALLETADYYFADQQFDVAQDAYEAFVRAYPRSEEIPRVRLRAAFASFAQFRGVLYDATALIDARAQLVDIQKSYPEMAAEENVASDIEQIDDAFAKKILASGRYYQRTGELKGAVFQYRILIQTYPSSPDARTAKEILARMPASALTDPYPPISAEYAPAPTTEQSTDVSKGTAAENH